MVSRTSITEYPVQSRPCAWAVMIKIAPAVQSMHSDIQQPRACNNGHEGAVSGQGGNRLRL
jgi:hypothetical protein